MTAPGSRVSHSARARFAASEAGEKFARHCSRHIHPSGTPSGEENCNATAGRITLVMTRAGMRNKVWYLAFVLTVVAVTVAGAVGLSTTPPTTAVTTASYDVTVNASGAGRTFDGVGAVLGGGDNSRYLADYPKQQRDQMLNDLFKPGYGASLQLLKIEIGGDDGGEATVEPANGQVNCNAGYGLSIARQAVTINPQLRLYGLQWSAPGWVGHGSNSVFTSNDIKYLMSWLSCAKRYRLHINYLGGWNESDNGRHAAWFRSLRAALNANGHASTQIVAADSFRANDGRHDPSSAWQYPSAKVVAILGAHDDCGMPTGANGPFTRCSITAAARNSGKPAWQSEVGGMDAGVQAGCSPPCAPAMDRVLTRGYIDARFTGYLEWPLVDAMPPDLPQENRGLITADQPWSGHYSVNAMTWAIAQFTQFVQPGWTYVNSASGYLRHNRADGSYVTLVSPGRDQWTTMIETTAGPAAPQEVTFTIAGGHGLVQKAIHVWASNFNPDSTRSQWFVRHPDIYPNSHRQFTIAVEPGYVYTLSTTTGQTRRAASSKSIPASASLTLPYANNLATSGNAGRDDDETSLLASIYGAFEVRRCKVADRPNTTCTEQTTPHRPILWKPKTALSDYYPYAILGAAIWTNYTIRSDVLFSQKGNSAGLIARFAERTGSASTLAGYIFDVRATGAWAIYRGNKTTGLTMLASGRVHPLSPSTWHKLSLTTSGDVIAAAVDGTVVGSAADDTYQAGPVGLEAGLSSHNWPQVQYSNLTITRAPTRRERVHRRLGPGR